MIKRIRYKSLEQDGTQHSVIERLPGFTNFSAMNIDQVLGVQGLWDARGVLQVAWSPIRTLALADNGHYWVRFDSPDYLLRGIAGRVPSHEPFILYDLRRLAADTNEYYRAEVVNADAFMLTVIGAAFNERRLAWYFLDPDVLRYRAALVTGTIRGLEYHGNDVSEEAAHAYFEKYFPLDDRNTEFMNMVANSNVHMSAIVHLKAEGWFRGMKAGTMPDIPDG